MAKYKPYALLILWGTPLGVLYGLALDWLFRALA